MMNLAWSTAVLVLAVFFLIYKYVTRNFDFWKKRNVFYLKPVPFLGNMSEVATLKTTIGEWLAKVYKLTDLPYFGIFVFHKPFLVLRSPQLIKLILQKDFDYFKDRTFFAGEHEKISSNVLFVMKSPSWRSSRKKVTPMFTSGRLKAMFPSINNIGKDMTKYLKKNFTQKSIEAKEVSAKYATDVLAKCAFSINAHSFDNDDAEFRQAGRSVFTFSLKNAINQLSHLFLPALVNLFRIHFLDKSVLNFLTNVFDSAIDKREKERANSENFKGNDLIDILVKIKKEDKLGEFNHDKLLAQPVQFFLAGTETTASTISFALYELCLHPHIQTKLREEIFNTINENNEITYEEILSMNYLDMCICETLRKYPVLPFLDRTCDADYKVPGTDLVIEKGTQVYIPMLGLHYDEKYFPNPEKYDPERFSDKSQLNQDGFWYIPFGEGPRICLGERFGLLSTKLALINILSKFELVRTEDTPDPLVYSPRSFALQPKFGLPMQFKPINY